jgi:hypothetical protein
MKKIILKSIAVMTAGLALVSNVYAEAQTAGSTDILPLDTALQVRASQLHKPRLAGSVGVDTYVMVINYTDTTIQADVPTGRITLTRRTAGRYQRSNYTGLSHIELFNENGMRFWSGDVGYQDLISVYLSNGKYVVYDTN